MSESETADEGKASRELTNEEIEAWSEYLSTDRNINEGLNMSLTTAISTDVNKSEIEDVDANIDIVGREGETTVRITTDSTDPHAVTFLDGSPDEMELIGRQMILTARFARRNEAQNSQ